MIYYACDMNCNNFGNFFRIIGHERDVKKDENSIILDGGHYPIYHCYRCKPPHPIQENFRYSEAIDILHPDDYVEWVRKRFLNSQLLKPMYDELQSRENNKTDYLSRMDLMCLLDLIMYYQIGWKNSPNTKGGMNDG